MRYICLPNELTKCNNTDYHITTIAFELCWHFCVATKTTRYTGSQANTIATSLAPCYHTLETKQVVELMGSMEINISFSCYCYVFELCNSNCERHIYPWRNNSGGWRWQNSPYPLSSGNLHRKYLHEDFAVLDPFGQNRNTSRYKHHVSASALRAKLLCNKLFLEASKASLTGSHTGFFPEYNCLSLLQLKKTGIIFNYLVKNEATCHHPAMMRK